ncbi:MAG: DUF1616 domain-containing protein [Chloroflexota bacterium]
MTVRLRDDLLWVNLLSLLLFLAITLFPSSVARVVLGLPLLLFVPGYALLALLFPKKDALDGIERVALSFGASIAVVPLLGLVLNYTPWGLSLYPILTALTVFVLVFSLFAWYRQRRLPESARLSLDFKINLPDWRGMGRLNRALSVVLVVTILGLLGVLGYILAIPKPGEQFTEFYLLGAQGKAADYPRELVLGEEARVVAGIINHESTRVSYGLEVRVNGAADRKLGPIALGDSEKWEEPVSFTARQTGDQQKVEFLLYKDGTPYLQPLYLWVNVRERK